MVGKFVMSLKDLTLNELYERLCSLRVNRDFLWQDEYEIIQEMDRREGERDR